MLENLLNVETFIPKNCVAHYIRDQQSNCIMFNGQTES